MVKLMFCVVISVVCGLKLLMLDSVSLWWWLIILVLSRLLFIVVWLLVIRVIG